MKSDSIQTDWLTPLSSRHAVEPPQKKMRDDTCYAASLRYRAAPGQTALDELAVIRFQLDAEYSRPERGGDESAPGTGEGIEDDLAGLRKNLDERLDGLRGRMAAIAGVDPRLHIGQRFGEKRGTGAGGLPGGLSIRDAGAFEMVAPIMPSNTPFTTDGFVGRAPWWPCLPFVCNRPRTLALVVRGRTA